MSSRLGTSGAGGGGGAGGFSQTNVNVPVMVGFPSIVGKGEYPRRSRDDSDETEKDRLQESINKWLSPPDPSTNHDIACATYHKDTALLPTWFFRGGGSIFQRWKGTASLLWIHAGSGKSVLCSRIINNIADMREVQAGKALMAYFYFDFKNVNKQHLHDLIPSLLTQLSAQLHPHRDILLPLYRAHDSGKSRKTQPSDLVLITCLRQILLHLPAERPIYLVMDALDECPDTSGIPSPRKRVLQLVEELVNLCLPNLHICVTSRPEIDIRDVLEPLSRFNVSLHEQSGQKKDIMDYVKSVVNSDSEPIMRRWKREIKDLVIDTLSKRADGTFRWAFCQLEALRHCLPSNVQRTLEELPESLDETYERILKDIKKPNRKHAHRIFQCLVVALRPLKVEELAEVLAIDFDDPEGIAKLKPNWRLEDAEKALLSSCSSLITIAADNSVQFAHSSVKEFLTSPRFATSQGDVSHYHIALKPAHKTLGQACLGVLLRSDGKASHLARYAAQHWVTHAQVGDVSSSLRKPMEYLFDLDKPYFTAWLKLHDVDLHPSRRPNSESAFSLFCPPAGQKLDAIPLYYAALCGFHDLAQHLIGEYSQQVDAQGGYYATPLVAALANKHFRVAQLLLHHGVCTTVNIQGYRGRIPLHSAAFSGQIDMVQLLLEHKADVKSQDHMGDTALHYLATIPGDPKGSKSPQNLASIAGLLLEHGADLDAQGISGWTPLHKAARCGNVMVAHVLIEGGADPNAKDDKAQTPFQHALERKQDEMIKLLSKQHSAQELLLVESSSH